ncbi:MAG: hypothetical protein ABSA26_16785 [Thermoguttaceae bacterium]|jgi:hypothetical protein
MQTSAKIWSAVQGQKEPSVVKPAKSYLVAEEGLISMDVPSRQRPVRMSIIIPQSINGQDIAMLLVPDELTGKLALNGQFLAAGAHILHHGDEICRDELRLWVSRDDSVKETEYDATIHGEDMFCARTRSRLIPGEPIIICPGIISAPCGMIFRASAWLNIKCHHCGFDPKEATWIPRQKGRGNIDELLQIAEQ